MRKKIIYIFVIMIFALLLFSVRVEAVATIDQIRNAGYTHYVEVLQNTGNDWSACPVIEKYNTTSDAKEWSTQCNIDMPIEFYLHGFSKFSGLGSALSFSCYSEVFDGFPVTLSGVKSEKHINGWDDPDYTEWVYKCTVTGDLSKSTASIKGVEAWSQGNWPSTATMPFIDTRTLIFKFNKCTAWEHVNNYNCHDQLMQSVWWRSIPTDSFLYKNGFKESIRMVYDLKGYIDYKTKMTEDGHRDDVFKLLIYFTQYEKGEFTTGSQNLAHTLQYWYPKKEDLEEQKKVKEELENFIAWLRVNRLSESKLKRTDCSKYCTCNGLWKGWQGFEDGVLTTLEDHILVLDGIISQQEAEKKAREETAKQIEDARTRVTQALTRTNITGSIDLDRPGDIEFNDVITDVVNDGGYYKPVNRSDDGDSEVEKKAGIILTVIVDIGMIVSLIIIAILGIKYMLGSVEEKAEYKKDMIAYLVGACLIFGITGISKLLMSLGQNISNF